MRKNLNAKKILGGIVLSIVFGLGACLGDEEGSLDERTTEQELDDGIATSPRATPGPDAGPT